MSDTEPAVVMWERVPPSVGHSCARLASDGTGWRAHGAEVLRDPDIPVACCFEVRLDEAWVTTAATVEAFSGDVARLDIRVDDGADRARRWWLDGELRPDLDGCIDIDVAATPLTNTFPIRRLQHLAPGDSVTSPVAWVEVPELRVHRVNQTYRRLDDVNGTQAWEYSDPLHGAFRLTVDSDGLVLDYEGFARRLSV